MKDCAKMGAKDPGILPPTGAPMRRLTLLLSLPAMLSAATPAPREMNLVSADGYKLKGTLTLPASRSHCPVVVLAHGFGQDRSVWASLESSLHQRGLATLALDLRGHGKSTQKGPENVPVTEDFTASSTLVGFERIPDDLIQAVNWVRKQRGINGRRVALAGSDLGATASLLAAPKVRPVAMLVLSPSGNAAFGENAQARLQASAKRSRAALMVLASAEDKEAANNLAALKPVFGTYARSTPGTTHGLDFIKEDAALMKIFLAEYLTQHPPTARPKPKEESPKEEPTRVITNETMTEAR